MSESKELHKQRFITNILYFLLIALLIWAALKYLLIWILPFIIGYFIAALVQPAVNLMYRRLRFKRRVAGVVAVLLFMVVIGLLLSLCITKAISELAAVAGLLPAMLEQVADSISRISARVSVYVDSLPVDYSENVARALENMANELMKLSSLSDGTISFIFNLLAKVPGLLLDTIVTVVSACFMSMDYGQIRGFVLRQLPQRYQDMACDIKSFLFDTIAKLIRAYLTLMSITFAELCIGLMLMGVEHAITIAVIIAIVDVLPVLGTGTVLVPWALIELMTGNVFLAICLIVLYAVVLVVRNILEPKIVGYHIGLYPLVTLIMMFVGLQIFGFTGMILFPLMIIVLKHLQDTGKFRLWKD
jgi:sporulation integral membrane protein YtvI